LLTLNTLLNKGSKNKPMKFAVTLFLFLLQFGSANAQTAKPGTVSKYDMVVSFGSMCCGTASDDFLKTYIKKITTTSTNVIKGWILGGCGREGEYKILLSFGTLKESEKLKLIEELKNLIDEQNKKNKAVNASSGSINFTTNFATTNFEYCRGELKELDK
jgi:hypothetical protein